MSRSNTIAFPSEFTEATSPASSRSLRVTAAGREFLRQRAFPWILLSAGLLLALIDPAVTASVAWLPFLVSLFLFGMPHGAPHDAAQHIAAIAMAREGAVQLDQQLPDLVLTLVLPEDG